MLIYTLKEGRAGLTPDQFDLAVADATRSIWAAIAGFFFLPMHAHRSLRPSH